jgi:hypothetical protein
VVTPPRERPSASRSELAPDVVSFDGAPCVHHGGREDLRVDVAGCQQPGSGGVLVSPDYPGVDAYGPFPVLVLIGTAAQLIENPLPRSITGPAAMAVVDGLPVPVDTRQVPPRGDTAGPPDHPVDHYAVIGPPATPTRGPVGQQLLQTSPLIIGQIMTIKHGVDLSHSPAEIHGTRPSRLFTGRVADARLAADEATEILALFDEWGEVDRSHRKLAHRGSYLGRVWV